jgi:ribose-phosphate pyrophosphokinase
MVMQKNRNVASIISPNCSDLASPSVVTKRFPDGESYCRLANYEDLKDKTVVILHRLFPKPDENLITLLQMMFGAKESGAKEIILIIPYLPYARADKQWLSGEIVSARLLIRLLKQSGCSHLYTWDCHFLHKPGVHKYEGLKITNNCIAKDLLSYIKLTKPDSLVVTPDMGSSYMVEGGLGHSMKKKRGNYEQSDDEDEAFRPVEEMQVDFDVKGKNVIVIDDMIAGGGTMAKAVQKCYEKGATSVSCAATHGMFLKGSLDRILAAGAQRISTTNTIKNPALGVDIKPMIKDILNDIMENK